MLKKHEVLPRLDKECLLAFVLKKKREFIVSHPKKTLSLFSYLRYRKLIGKRISGIPLAYLTKEKDFFGLAFLVNQHTLIPRPDTEIMVEKTLEYLKHNETLVDIGTGSGCVPIAIAHTAQKEQKHLIVHAVDISKKALDIVRKNARKHGVEITTHHGHLLEPIKKLLLRDVSCITITANLPYLTEKQFTQEPSIQYEPKDALVAEDGGLALYKELLKQIKEWGDRPKTIRFFFEIDPTQGHKLQQHIVNMFPKSNVLIELDLAGHERLVYGTIQ